MARLRTAVIGVGHLGKEHARILAGFPDVELVGVADIDPQQAAAVAARCGSRAYPFHQPLLELVEAATVAVPTTMHAAVAREFLRRGVHLLVEKPLADSPQAAQELVDLARRHGAQLQVGHVERYNPAFEELKVLNLKPRFIEGERLTPYSGRSTDVGVVLDLMVHDLELLPDLAGAPVESVEAYGYTVFGRHEDVAHARLVFANGCEAHVTASRASAAPRRRMRLWAGDGYAGVDFAARSLAFVPSFEPFRKQGLDFWRQDPAGLRQVPEEVFGRQLQLLRPQRDGGDSLTRELRDFVDCARSEAPPRTRGEAGRDAVTLAARVLQCIKSCTNRQPRGFADWHSPFPRDSAA
jgi:predicted dehydrogenase